MKSILQRIRTISCFEASELDKVLIEISDHLDSENDDFYNSLGMVLIDPITTYYSVFDNATTIKIEDRNVLMVQFIKRFKQLLFSHGISGLVTNHSTKSTTTNEQKVALGVLWSNLCHYQLQFITSDIRMTVELEDGSNQRVGVVNISCLKSLDSVDSIIETGTLYIPIT